MTNLGMKWGRGNVPDRETVENMSTSELVALATRSILEGVIMERELAAKSWKQAYKSWKEAGDIRNQLYAWKLELLERSHSLDKRERALNRREYPRNWQNRYIPQLVRKEVLERDKYTCQHCGVNRNLSLDHIYPFSLGGTHEPDNLQTLCRSCNSRKHAKVNYRPPTTVIPNG